MISMTLPVGMCPEIRADSERSYLGLGSLCQDVASRICAYLTPVDIQNALFSSRSVVVIKSGATLREFFLIRYFIKHLIESLGREISLQQQEKLETILSNIASRDFENLRILKQYIFDIKVCLIEIIKSLDEPKKEGLKKRVDLSYFFENIFELDRLDNEGHARLWDELIRKSKIDRAIEVLRLISFSSVDLKIWVRQMIGKLVTEKTVDKIDRIIKFATLIPVDELKSIAIEDASVLLRRLNKIEKAREVAELIVDEESKGYALKSICLGLLDQGNIEGAIDVASSIISEHYRNHSLSKIIEHLRSIGEVQKADEIAEEMLGEAWK
jgi:hypothetical protein